jgi:hypothetical protein
VVEEAKMRDSQKPTQVDEERAAALLGLSTGELLRLSAETGVGRAEPGSDSAHRVFTYAELYRMCRVAVQVSG